MDNILSSILTDPSYSNYIQTYLSDWDRENLIRLASTINKKVLYSSHFHGLHHSEKVMLNAYVIGKHLQLNAVDFQILMDAALYHDIGRSNDTEDNIHGYSSTLRLPKVVISPIYQDSTNLEILKAICDGHSRDDKFCEQTFMSYDIDEKEYSRYEILYKALKDADALDRTRFGKTTKAALQSQFLRLDISKSLIEFASVINDMYANYISQKMFDKFDEEYNIGEFNLLCQHGIGFNLFQLQSILNYGILSEYAMTRNGLSKLRNFKGNNNQMWISAVPYGKQGKAYHKFIQQGISFVGKIPKWHGGVESISDAKSTGLPHKADLYDDEVFVFDCIPKERICALVIPKQCIKQPLNTLYYLNGSLNYDIVFEKVQYYRQKILEFCGLSCDTTEISKILFEMQSSVLGFEQKSRYEQEKTYQEYFNKMDIFAKLINEQLQSWMLRGFQEKYKTTNILTLGDVLQSFLQDIDYQMVDNGEQIEFRFATMEKEKSK